MAGKIHSGGTVHFSITRRPPRGTPRRRENSHRAASATFALKVGVWFRRGRLFMVSPDSLGTACPLSGRNSTYRLVQISETSSEYKEREGHCRVSQRHQENGLSLGLWV